MIWGGCSGSVVREDHTKRFGGNHRPCTGQRAEKGLRERPEETAQWLQEAQFKDGGPRARFRGEEMAWRRGGGRGVVGFSCWKGAVAVVVLVLAAGGVQGSNLPKGRAEQSFREQQQAWH